MNIDEAARAELLHKRKEDLRGIAVGNVVGGRDRRKPDADPLARPDAEDRIDDFERKAQTVIDRTAVSIGAMIGLVSEELIDQIAVGAMNFDAVEARLFGILGSDT